MKLTDVLYSGLIGLLLGSLLDYFLGYRMGMWEYNRHPYWEWRYWACLPVMWAMFGVYVVIAWRKIRWLTIPTMLMLHESYGVIRNSWEYSENWGIVIAGWIPLIVTIVVIMEFIKSRRLEDGMEITETKNTRR